MDFAVPADHRVRLKESEKKKESISGPCQRAEGAMEHEGGGDTNRNWWTWNDLPNIGKGTERLRNQRTSRDYPDFTISKIDKNTEINPGVLLSLKHWWKTIS